MGFFLPLYDSIEYDDNDGISISARGGGRRCPVQKWWDARFWMSRANASKSGMLPGSSSLMSSSDASLADILELAEAAGEGGGGGGWSVVCGVLL